MCTESEFGNSRFHIKHKKTVRGNCTHLRWDSWHWVLLRGLEMSM